MSSLPLTRRIARAALLVAAGAAAGVGVAGTASAAPAAPLSGLGGLTSLDTAGVSNTLDSTTQAATETAGQNGAKVTEQAVPAVGKSGGQAVKKVTPPASKAAGATAGASGDLVGDTAKSATKGGLPTDSLTKGAQTLPLKGLPLGG
ncbi:ATP-binding protein [Streptomyces niveiscabiei]|uniref:ATP-binding protein n=1 Tax=Streptomyces niveiscabiei TaxID=164115 RepID=UPI0029ABBC4F|nr:ATP-binding protein [Streptomyces niveiscabiei]MDX3384852.1 ATP-binding protein [Streptomyces niveiscabiei]